MLKLDTQPRSRQKRNGWRATPGHSGGWSVPPPPPNASSDAPEEACRGPRGTPEQAGVAARARASGPVGGRSVSPAQEQSGEPSSERRTSSARWWSAAALFFPAQKQSEGPQRPTRTCPARRPEAGRSALPRHATRLRRERSWRRPRVPRHPERPAPRSCPPPVRPLALTACETARCQRQSTAGRRQGAGPWSVPEPASHGPGCSPPLRFAPRWTKCPTTAACRRETRDDEEAGGSKPPWSARGCAAADVGQVPNAPLLHRRGPSTRSAVTLPSPDIP